MLTIELAPKAAHSRVILDGRDISRFVKAVEIHATAGDDTHVAITYFGPVVVDGAAGTTTLIPSSEAQSVA